MKINHRLNAILIIGLTLGIGFTISVVSAAPKITVTSAVPAEAEQGTTNLTVIINGRGFDQKMDVKFCRSETNDTCVDGGVDVKGSVEFISSKQLKVTVDVGLKAIIGNFDIEAISLSSGRRGRGTEKFAVLKAGGGGKDSATYSVAIDGAVSGESGNDDWRGGFVGKNGIGLNVPGWPFTTDNSVGQLTLSFFTMPPLAGPFTLGTNCFGSTGFVFLGQADLKQGKHGRAEGRFWFRGHTDDGGTEVSYLLAVVGSVDGDWPPSDPASPTTMTMDTWEMSVSESGPIKNRSCGGDGDFINNLNGLDDEVVITVTLVE